MKTTKTSFGEIKTKFVGKHPDNEDFMNPVFWTIWEKPDGRVIVSYKLGPSSLLNKSHFIYGLSKEEVIKRYFDQYWDNYCTE